jgi:hypothetical protein
LVQAPDKGWAPEERAMTTLFHIAEKMSPSYAAVSMLSTLPTWICTVRRDNETERMKFSKKNARKR